MSGIPLLLLLWGVSSVFFLAGFVFCSMYYVVKEKKSAATDDYIDWSKVPEWAQWVAHHEDGETWAYPDDGAPPEMSEKSGWFLRPRDNPSSLHSAIRIYDDAIIGPLPPWRESLRKRPTVEAERKPK